MGFKQFLETVPLEIKAQFQYRTYEKDACIFLPEQDNELFMILLSGTAECYLQNYKGALISVFLYQPYDCFGEIEIFQPDYKTYGMIAKTPCKVVLMRKEVLFQWMQADFAFTKHLIRRLCEKMIDTSQSRTDLTLYTVRERLLLSIYTHEKRGTLSDLTKEMLVSEVGTPMRSINRAVDRLKADGLIRYQKKQFFIADTRLFEKTVAELL